MKYLLILVLLLLWKPLLAQEVEIIKFPQLESIINNSGEEILVVNFWATWCKPCVKELPYFESLQQEYREKGVKVLLVSLDFAEDLEKKVIPFIAKREMNSEVKILDETDFNVIIDKIDPSWSGAIPATLLVNRKTGNKLFFEKEFKAGELETLIKDQLN